MALIQTVELSIEEQKYFVDVYKGNEEYKDYGSQGVFYTIYERMHYYNVLNYANRLIKDKIEANIKRLIFNIDKAILEIVCSPW